MFRKMLLIVCMVCCCKPLAAEGLSLMTVEWLRCEYLEHPLGLDMPHPRLSWRPASEKRGAAQSAYRILVASSPEILAEDTGDCWDTGKVASDESLLIPYDGVSLTSNQRCWWKVRVWDAQDTPSAWSETAQFTTGLLSPSDWTARYIAMDPEKGAADNPWLRHTFNLEAAPEAALIHVNALGYYELYLNGKKVHDTVLVPAVTQYNKRSFYRTHDITAYLKPGKNCIALWLGRGWYVEGLPGVAWPGPVVRAQLHLRQQDGKNRTIGTGPDWKAHPSPIKALGNGRSGHLGGERYDASLEIFGWDRADFDDSAWPEAATPAILEHKVTWQPVQGNRIQDRIDAVSVKPYEGDTWLVDFGSNFTGWLDIRFDDLEKGRMITIDYADHLDEEDGFNNFGQIDIYKARGKGDERFISRFNYHAFRYARIRGLDTAPEPGSMQALLIHTDYALESGFSCSNDLLTDIHDMVFYTLRCLSIGGNLVDCPHIERLGYGGDGQASTPTALTLFGMAPLYRAWLSHWRDCQRPDGDMPHTAPNPYNAGGGPYWCGFIIAASYEVFLQHNDTRILEVNYPAMQRWLDGYVRQYSPDGLLETWPNQEYRNWYLGDWAKPDRSEKEEQRSVHLVNNCFIVECRDWMARIAEVLGKPEDAARYREEAAAQRAKIHAEFFDPDNNTYADDTQLDLAYPLLTGVTPEPRRAAVLKRLEEKILVEKKGHLDVGLAGIPLLTESLMRNRRNDLVFSYLNKETFPGYGFMLKNGATTTWEHWDGHRSRIHNCYNGIGAWFYRGLAGIRPDADRPGFRHFRLHPAITGGITQVSAWQDTAAGRIESAWQLEDGGFRWEVVIPANTSAEIVFPESVDAAGAQESGKPIAEAEGITTSGGKIQAAAGHYTFTASVNGAE
jgi:alpha-L-rhamnosidase